MHKKSRWLKAAGIKSETEGFIIAAIDQTIKTNYYRCKILKNGTDPVCRIIMRSIPGNHWPCRGKVPWAGQNWIPTQIQQDRHIPTLEHININTKGKWYDHEPQTVTEKENITISWDMPIQNRSWDDDDDDDDDHHNDHYQDDDNNDNSDSIIYYLKTNKGLDLGMEPSICKSWLSTPFPRRNIFNQPFVVSVFPHLWIIFCEWRGVQQCLCRFISTQLSQSWCKDPQNKFEIFKTTMNTLWSSGLSRIQKGFESENRAFN